MGNVTAGFTMSLDGFIAGPNDEVDRLFRWYSSGDTEFPVTGTEMVFKISRANAELLQETWSTFGALVTGRRDFDMSGAWGWQASFGRADAYRDLHTSTSMDWARITIHVCDGRRCKRHCTGQGHCRRQERVYRRFNDHAIVPTSRPA